jgi:2-amino-4-hydroxy-6-hydroxymethyldihydropteridine diphosphokinase
MDRYYLSLGSNLGDRPTFLTAAVERIRRLGRITAASSVYDTDPVGFEDQPRFLNMVLEVETALPPADLWRRLQEIEREVGKKATVRFGPREIDIDMLLWSGGALAESGLRIPHPRLMQRAFVLVPLAEIAPLIALPGLETAAEAAERIGAGGVVKWGPPFGLDT